MSTPKRIREIYENTFKKLIRPTQHFLSQLKEPPQLLKNLPIKLSEVSVHFAIPTMVAKPRSKVTKKRVTKPRASRKKSA